MARTRAATQRRHNAARIVRLRLTEHRAFNVAFYTVFSWTHSSVCNVTRCVCVCEHPATLRKETKDAARQTYVTHCAKINGMGQALFQNIILHKSSRDTNNNKILAIQYNVQCNENVCLVFFGQTLSSVVFSLIWFYLAQELVPHTICIYACTIQTHRTQTFLPRMKIVNCFRSVPFYNCFCVYLFRLNSRILIIATC